jgi:hypothetical protein
MYSKTMEERIDHAGTILQPLPAPLYTVGPVANVKSNQEEMDVSVAYQQEQLHIEFQDPHTDETRL